jgi:hypothetical protein
MAVSVASFKVAFPEFVKSDPAMLTAQLAMVELEVSDSFGESRDLAVMLKLADVLAQGPAGRDARMVPKGVENAFSSTYGIRYRAMCEANAVSASRLGSTSGCT